MADQLVPGARGGFRRLGCGATSSGARATYRPPASPEELGRRWGIPDAADREWMFGKVTPQPAAAMAGPVRIGNPAARDIPRSFIGGAEAGFQPVGRHTPAKPAGGCITSNRGHDPMVSHPPRTGRNPARHRRIVLGFTAEKSLCSLWLKFPVEELQLWMEVKALVFDVFGTCGGLAQFGEQARGGFRRGPTASAPTGRLSPTGGAASISPIWARCAPASCPGPSWMRCTVWGLVESARRVRHWKA